MSAQRLPNFFIVGAPKAGTTSLYHHLRQHPDVYMSPLKETSYFSTEFRVENLAPELQAQARRGAADLQRYFSSPPLGERFGGIVTDWKDYLSLFTQAAEEIAVGEASPSYLWSPTAPFGIAKAVPEARIVMILRNPIERAVSQYRQMFHSGSYGLSFDEHIDVCLAARSTERISMTYPFLEYGLYSEQVQRYRSLFPQDQLSIWLYEDTLQSSFLPLIFDFLGVDTAFAPDTSVRYLQQSVPRVSVLRPLLSSHAVAASLKALIPKAVRPILKRVAYRPCAPLDMSAKACTRLREYYRADVESLSGLLGRDLSHWLSH